MKENKTVEYEIIDRLAGVRPTVKDYKSLIGYVPQDPFLFDTTIKNNLIWANQDASEEEIKKAINKGSSYIRKCSDPDPDSDSDPDSVSDSGSASDSDADSDHIIFRFIFRFRSSQIQIQIQIQMISYSYNYSASEADN